MKIGRWIGLTLGMILMATAASAAEFGPGDPALPIVRAAIGMSEAQVQAGSTLHLADAQAAIVPLAPVRFVYVEGARELPVGAFCRDQSVRHCQDSALVLTLGGSHDRVDTIQVIFGGLTLHDALALADRWRTFFVDLSYAPNPSSAYAFECQSGDKAAGCLRGRALPRATSLQDVEKALLVAQPEFREPDAFAVFLGRSAAGAEAAIRISTSRANAEQGDYSPSAAEFENVYTVTLFINGPAPPG